MSLDIKLANYTNNTHCQSIVELMDAYARSKEGGETPLTKDVKNKLCFQISQIEGAFSILAFSDNSAIGLINCFQGFSTFSCKPLINIHDVFVAPAHRKKGVANAMLAMVEAISRKRDCCKITLEVLEGNQAAKRVYKRDGFSQYSLSDSMGSAQFWEKSLS